MPTLPDAVIGDAYTTDHPATVLEALVECAPRMAGWSGEHEAAKTLAETFSAIGCRDVTTEPFEIPGWWRGSSSLSVTSRVRVYEHQHEILALPGSPAGTVSGRLVDVGYGMPADFDDAPLEDNIALVSSASSPTADRWRHRIEKYGYAVEAGAAGFVFRNHVGGCLPPTGSINELDGPAAIPGVGVSKEVGAQLERYCAREESDATLTVDCETGGAESRNVTGVLGPDTDRELLITAHLDAHDIATGAQDNGAGCALVAEVGRLLAAVEPHLETRVRLLIFGAEEVGLLGSRHYAETTDLDSIAGVLNIDSAGQSRNLAVITHGFETIARAAERTANVLECPIDVRDEFSPHSDHWPFVERGLPGAQLRSVTDDSGRGWGHTHGDTLEKLDMRDVRDIAICVTNIAFELTGDADSLEPASEETIKTGLLESGEAEGMKASGEWPFDE
ncbi:M28 family metallopeptidase [Halobacteria archaeon AArc-curdl1]|uniref:Carboxypeptidase Q n=1 Tax=Natronosalvus hydrolyticus TaxID=2979988 RepID=A0AAP2Z6F5_9EURY|nr:M28 family metallopeptidase [Halobacteria archaeon AArc-curdl1]